MADEDLKFHKNFEDEVEADLGLDDADVLSKRYVIRRKMNEIEKLIDISEKMTPSPHPSCPLQKDDERVKLAMSLTGGKPPTTISQIARTLMKPATINQIRKALRPQTQWTRIQDAVQEHFSSHITIGNSTHKLPKSICALKYLAKHSWVLYKKRECERRKRIRAKLDNEKKKEKMGKPANILLSMVDMCEICKRLYVTVNLFWGVTLCDTCYFNPHTLNEIMKSRLESCEQKAEITTDSIAEEIIRQSNSNPTQQLESILPTNSVTKSTSFSTTSEDFRKLSSYVPPPHLYSTAEDAVATSLPLEEGNPLEVFETSTAEIFTTGTPFDFGVDIESLEDLADEYDFGIMSCPSPSSFSYDKEPLQAPGSPQNIDFFAPPS